MHVWHEDKSGMICGCQKHRSAAVWPMRTHFLVSEPEPSAAADLVTRRCESSPSRDAQKNVLWHLRNDAPQFLRPHEAAGAGLVERTVPHFARHRGASDSMPPVRCGEARAPLFPGRQSVLHQALCLLRRSALSSARSRTSPRSCCWTGIRSRSSTSTTCRRSSRAPAHRGRR